MSKDNLIFPISPVKAAPAHVDALTINWHVTEACNYRCQYCYAKWTDHPCPRELFHDRDRSQHLLAELFRYFQPTNTSNPLREALSWHTLRLNLAGGEPSILGERLLDITRAAKQLGFEVSLISNASRLTSDVIKQLAPQLTYLGVSLDSTHSGTNLAIGRVERSGQRLSLNELTANLDFARQVNPALKIKINTVVNALNADEDLSGLITRVRPERWKVLRMLPIVDATLAVSDEAFAAFVERHSAFRSIQCVEDNSDMCESYLMVDPYGRFFQNQAAGKGGYLYSQPILPSGAAAAFSEMRFNPAGFRSRYTTAQGEAS